MEKFMTVKTLRQLIAECPEEFLDQPLSLHVNDQWFQDVQIRFSDDHKEVVIELWTDIDLNK